jgi:hypothetical protein
MSPYQWSCNSTSRRCRWDAVQTWTNICHSRLCKFLSSGNDCHMHYTWFLSHCTVRFVHMKDTLSKPCRVIGCLYRARDCSWQFLFHVFKCMLNKLMYIIGHFPASVSLNKNNVSSVIRWQCNINRPNWSIWKKVNLFRPKWLGCTVSLGNESRASFRNVICLLNY